MKFVDLTGFEQTVDIPCFQSFRANVTLPKNNGGGSNPITLKLESSTDKPLGAPSPSPGTGTPLFYESFKATAELVLDGTTVTANISSQGKISPTHTYAANVYLDGIQLVPTVTGLVPSGHNLSITITVPPRTKFPAHIPAQVVLYESS